jgi:glycerol uptake facilitator protein
MSPFLGEIIGTMILIIFGCGVVGGVLLNKSKAQNSGWVIITFGWGLGVAMAVYAVGSISGAHLNPAVTLALAATESFPWEDVPSYIAAQFTGAIIGAVIVYFHYLPHWKETTDSGLKLAVFSTSPAIHNPLANFISEMIGTFILVLAILAIGANEFTQGLNPLIIGFLIVSIGISLGGPTGYAINPARDLGPRIAHFLLPIAGKDDSGWNYAWIPVTAPIAGGVYGAFFYKALFKGEFSTIFWILSAAILGTLLSASLKEWKNAK